MLVNFSEKKNFGKQIFPKNVCHCDIFAYVKNRIIRALAINILNLKPLDFFFVSVDSSPRFHQQRRPT